MFIYITVEIWERSIRDNPQSDNLDQSVKFKCSIFDLSEFFDVGIT